MRTRRSALSLLAAAPFAAGLARGAHAATPPVYAEDGIAIDGSDAVAYFDKVGPVAGSTDYPLRWHGAIWRFATAANRAAFEADPMRYAPQYGGYCAYALSQGAIASTVPEAWTILGDKLYLNYSLDVRQLWRQNMHKRISQANANWPGILS